MSDGALGVSIRGLRKRYGDTVALDGLDLEARPGEILGVAGPNGAGKSTMVKILAGEVERDEGEILVDGTPWTSGVGSHRVAVVHQEPQLFPNLTVAENVLAGYETRGWRWPKLDASHSAVLDRLAIEPRLRNAGLGGLGLALQQRTEISRALAREARVVLFDEPNSALTPGESEEFFALMHQLADAGHVVMLISHRLTELAAHADRVAVIVDGRCVRVLEGVDKTPESIAEMLVRGLGSAAATESGPAAAAGGGLDLSVSAGAVTALSGVEGSGAREIVRACAGLRRFSGGVSIAGRPVRPSRLADRVSFVAADRAASLFSNLSVEENLVIRLDSEISRGMLGLRPRRMRAIAQELSGSFHVKSAGLDVGVRSLSGGNQQKVAIAAAVGAGPDVLVLEEPTRGVDISSKAEIYSILRRFATDGGAVLLFCTEIPEVYEVADRLHVVAGGRLSDVLDVASFADMESLAKTVAGLETHAGRAVA